VDRLFGGTVRIGAWSLTSLTTTSKLRVTLSGGEALSVTRTMMRLVLVLRSPGVQVNMRWPGHVAPAGVPGASE